MGGSVPAFGRRAAMWFVVASLAFSLGVGGAMAPGDWAADPTPLGLVPSGGSDDHGTLTGHRIGCETIAPESYHRLVAQASGAAPVRM